MAVTKSTLLTTLKKVRQTADIRYNTIVEKLETATTGYAASYVVKQNNVQVGATINIPKDFLVKSASIEVVAAADKAASGKFENNESFALNDKYIDFVVNTLDSDATDTHIYLNVNDLVDVYSAGNGIVISPNNIMSLNLDSENAHGLGVTANGLGLSLVTSSTSGVMSATDKEKLDNYTNFTHPTYTATTGIETADLTPNFGDTISVSQISSDVSGHLTSQTTRTITMPSTNVVASVNSIGGTNGLMSAADKEKLNNALLAYTEEICTAEELAEIWNDALVLTDSKYKMMDIYPDTYSSMTTIFDELNTNNVTNMKNMFYNCTNLTSIPQLDTSNVTEMYGMFWGCSALTTIPKLGTSKVTGMGGMFNTCNNLVTIPQLDTSNVTSMNHMFMNCTSLASIPQLDTSNVTNMSYMFVGCTSLPATFPWTIDCSNISDVNSLSDMFKGSSVTEVTLVNVNSSIKSEVTSQKLKGYNTLTINFV